jgi:hypothetical protein
MHHPHRNTAWRLLALTMAACCLGASVGCQQLNLFSVHNEPAKPTPTAKVAPPAKVDVANPAPEPPVTTALPGKCQYRASQYLFLADFEINHDLPIFKELTDLRDQLHKSLQLPSSNNLIQVYLFEDRVRYERFMTANYPDLPKRRAFFVAPPRPIGQELLVYVFWGTGERIQQDLRHEVTHALLHSVLKDVPLWLDEGLAEYFELPPANHGVNPDHLRHLRYAKYDLARLEQLTEVEQMTTAEYREAWAWVHLMMHTSDESRKVLISYLRELRQTRAPGSLRSRLASVVPAPEMALERHLMLLDNGRLPVAAAQ